MHLPPSLSYSKYVAMRQNFVEAVCALTLAARRSWNGDLLRGMLGSKKTSQKCEICNAFLHSYALS